MVALWLCTGAGGPSDSAGRPVKKHKSARRWTSQYLVDNDDDAESALQMGAHGCRGRVGALDEIEIGRVDEGLARSEFVNREEAPAVA